MNKHVNESKRTQELRQRLYKLQNSVKDKCDIFSRVTRQLIKEGSLYVHELREDNKGKDDKGSETHLFNLTLKKMGFRDHYFFLFDDLLLEVTKVGKNEKSKYKFIRKFDLKTLRANAWEKQKEKELKGSVIIAAQEGGDIMTQILSSQNINLGSGLMSTCATVEEEDKLVIYLFDGSKRFLVKCKTPTEREEWRHALEKQISDGTLKILLL